MVMRDRWAIMSEGTSLHAGTRLIEIIGARPARENGGAKIDHRIGGMRFEYWRCRPGFLRVGLAEFP